MDELTKKWTVAWHAVMDQELGPEDNAKIEKRYTDSDGDFRLHFDFWSLSEAGKRKCFAMLPLGNEIADRALEKHAWETNMIITEAEAEKMLRSAIRDLSYFTKLDISADDPIEIIRGREEELKSLDADYIEASTNINPFANILRMNRSEIKWLKTQDGLIIFYNQDETINDVDKIDLQLNGSGLQEISDEVLQWVEQREAHHLKRGFPPDRLRECEVGVSGSKPYQIVLRDVDAPEQAVEGELPYTGRQTIKDGVLYTKGGYGLFIHGQHEGIHTEQVSISTHYKNGKHQRKHLA